VPQARPGDPGRPGAPAGRPGSTVAGRYRLDAPLATTLPGSERWSATDQILARRVTVTLVQGPRTAAVLDAARRAALVVDPRLARILDVGSADGTGYVVTEAVEGRSLAALAARAPLGPDQARAVVGEAAAALEAARRRGVHHLALRPESVVLTSASRVVVEGLAVDGELLGAGGGGAHAKSRADTVGLVRVLYAALTGRWPAASSAPAPAVPTFDEWSAGPALAPAGDAADVDPGLPAAPTHDEVPLPPADLVPGVPADLDTLCVVTLGPHDDGPHSPGELVRELEPWRAVRSDEIFRAADAGRWPALPDQAGSRDPGGSTTPAPPTGSSPMSDDQHGSTPTDEGTPKPGAGAAGAGAAAGAAGSGAAGSGAAAGAAGSGAAAGATAAGSSAAAQGAAAGAAAGSVARQTVRSALGAVRGAGSRRPGTPPPAAAGPGAFPPAAPTAPVRSTTRPTPVAPPAAAATPTPDAAADAAATSAEAAAGASTPATGTTEAPPAIPPARSGSAAEPATATAPGMPPAIPPAGRAESAPTTPTPAAQDAEAQDPEAQDPKTRDAKAPDAPADVAPAAGSSSADADAEGRQPAKAADQAVAGITSVGAASAGAAATGAPADGTAGAAPAAPASPVRRSASAFSSGAPRPAGAESAPAPAPAWPTPAPGSRPAPAARADDAAPTAALFGTPEAPATSGGSSEPGRPAWDLPFPAEEPAPSFGQRRFDPTRWVIGLVAVAVVVGLVIAIGNVLAPFGSGGDDSAGTTPAPSASAPAPDQSAPAAAEGEQEPAPQTAPPVIAAVSSIDPSDGDGEHEELVGRLTDGDPATSWYTHTYNRPDFAGFKDAVGLVITLQAPATVTSVTLDVNGSGGNVEVRSTDAANPTAGDVLASGPLSAQTVLTLSQPTETQSIVLWFTALAQAPDGANKIEISSLAVS
jgi:hypothetical protein